MVQGMIYNVLLCIIILSCSRVQLQAQNDPSVQNQEQTSIADETEVHAKETAAEISRKLSVIIGTNAGLFGMDRWGTKTLLWQGGAVRKILRTNEYWALLTDQGIAKSTDLLVWETCNTGLPSKTLKIYEEGTASFVQIVQDIKDLAILPNLPNVMVCAVKDAVFLSQDAGRTWQNLGTPHPRTDGIKAVGLALLPELTVFVSHSIYGVSYFNTEKPSGKWAGINAGLESMETLDNPDEVSCFTVVYQDAQTAPVLYASQTFRGRIYRLDWERKTFIPIFTDDKAFSVVDSLQANNSTLRFIQQGAVRELFVQKDPKAPLQSWYNTELLQFIREIPETFGLHPSCLFMQENVFNPDSTVINLSELWLLFDEPAHTASEKEGLYIPLGYALEERQVQSYIDLLKEHQLNMIVIDMKDDYGRLRFNPNNPALLEKGRIFSPMDLDMFLSKMKEAGIYTVARLVVFKDPELVKKEEGRFAVWDTSTNKPWIGYNKATRGYYDERWVDPFSEGVWEYNTSVAVELYERGFDEIQFDYIRFPTDGDNIGNAEFRWQDPRMDKDSAILSFLHHVRSRLKAPISIDIYGSNGWYRSGSRTGQEVELLSRYVDVICPMYYPSHFEQDFLAQKPAQERPYRIYYYGTLRTKVISRNTVVVRPWVQVFFLNVSYDRQYYNKDYVRRQVEGVGAAGEGGFTYWNNSGRYDDIM
ncbi:MAG: hypothetical protein LBB43_02455 [Spirochaetaceae bacterium]|nr:hypothetical protein [Spirochaetaceae bacterium]